MPFANAAATPELFQRLRALVVDASTALGFLTRDEQPSQAVRAIEALERASLESGT